MNLKEQAATWLKSVISAHVGANIRRYKWSTYTGEISHNMLGGVNYLSPAEGKVVEQDEQFTLIKSGPSSFCVVATEHLSAPVAVGDKVEVKFYKLRRFDGTAADGSDDPSDRGSRTIMLTGAETFFPAKWQGRYLAINDRFSDAYTEIGNPYLRDMIEQMEKLRVDGGMRRVVNVLVDAGATNLNFIDPKESDSALIAPAITAEVKTAKFQGTVMLGYDRAADTYFIDLSAGPEQEPRRIEDVHFNEVGEHLIDAIDDRAWLKAKVTVLKKAPTKKATPELP